MEMTVDLDNNLVKTVQQLSGYTVVKDAITAALKEYTERASTEKAMEKRISHGRGMLKDLNYSTEDFMREKEEEKALE
jgi:Arc/MetJ family transcription regulator